MRLGLPELLIILVVVLLVMGPSKLPQLGDALGKTLRNFKKASNQDDSIDVTPHAREKEQLGQGAASAAAGEAAHGRSDRKA